MFTRELIEVKVLLHSEIEFSVTMRNHFDESLSLEYYISFIYVYIYMHIVM
jgi:hypothetical protein